MEAKITSQSDTQASFTVSLSADTLNSARRSVLDTLRKRVKASGFRPGKAPDMIVERELGSQTIQSEVIDHALQSAYVDAINELGLAAVGTPKVSLEKFVPYTELTFGVTVELLPKVTLLDYKKMRLKRKAVEVDAAEIERALEELRRREAVRLDSEMPAKLSDEVNFDFDGTKDGQPVKGASAKGQVLRLGSASFIPGFEDQIVGLAKGESKTFEIRFPKKYHEPSLADQLVSFSVKINSVTDLVLPELNEELLKKISPFATAEELRADIAQRIMAQKTEDNAREYEQDVLDKVLAGSKYQVPQVLVREQLAKMRQEMDQNLSYSGLTVDKYLELTHKSADDLAKEMTPEAEKRVALAMLLTEVARREGLAVSKEELDVEIARLKSEYADPKTQAELSNPATREEVYNHLMSSKVIATLVGFAATGD